MSRKYDSFFQKGDKYDKWVIIGEVVWRTYLDSRIKKDGSVGVNYQAFIEVQCECGQKDVVSCRNLETGKTHQCKACSNSQRRNTVIHKLGYKEIPKTWFSAFEVGAKKRNLDFTVSYKTIYAKWIEQHKKCALSGLAIDFKYSKKSKHGKYYSCSASLDRIDSSKGYIPGNIQLVHKTVNTMKNKFNEDDFVQFCRAIAEHSKNREHMGLQRVRKSGEIVEL